MPAIISAELRPPLAQGRYLATFERRWLAERDADRRTIAGLPVSSIEEESEPDERRELALIRADHALLNRLQDRQAALAADDEADLRQLVRLVLERAGARVVEASDGRSGLRALFVERPHAVVLDLMMPGLDGWATLERSGTPATCRC